MNENQGKRPDQLKYSEKVVFYCFIVIVTMLIVMKITN